MRAMRMVTWIGIAGALTGCGPTHEEVLSEYRDRFDGIRAAFAEIAKALPPAGSAKEGARVEGLDPKPVYDDLREVYNTEVVMEDQLADPDGKFRDPLAFDLILSRGLLRGIQWTGPRSPMSDSTRGARASTDFRKELDDALGLRYLLVNRILEHVPPVGVDENNFRGGRIRLEAFLVDLKTKQVLVGFPYSATTSDRVQYTYRGQENKKEALRSWAASSLYENARKALMKAFPQATGGTFEIK